MEAQIILLPHPGHDPHPLIEKTLSEEFRAPISLDHESSGKPFLSGTASSISLSHCQSTIGILLGPPGSRLGIDVEDKWRQAVRVLPRYTSEEERNILERIGWLHPLWLWTAKEAVFKAFSERITHFTRDITFTGVQNDGALLVKIPDSAPIIVQRKLYDFRCAVSIVQIL